MKSLSGTLQNLFFIASLIVLASLVTGCASIATGAHYDETTDFGLFRSFSWIDDHPLILGSDDAGTTTDPLAQSKIQQAIRSGFENKGYTFVEDRDQADFVVAYTIGTREKISVNSYPSPYYGSWGWHVRGSHYYINEVSAHTYTKSTLAIDVFDRASRKPVWHGWSEKTITSDDKRDPTPSIDASVSKLLELFPH